MGTAISPVSVDPRAKATRVCAACGGHSLVFHLAVGRDVDDVGLIPTTDRFGSALSDIVRCVRCGHMQLAALPISADLLEEYADAESMDYVAEEAGQRETARTTLQTLERHGARGALLDVGCWVGFLLDEARLRGWDGVGLEPSRFASEFARVRLGLDVRTANLFDVELEPGRFDAAVLADVLEHFPDPGAALDEAGRWLSSDGLIYLALPDAGSRVARALGARWWSVIPTHVQYFTRGSLHTLLRRHSWEIVEMRTAPKVFTVRYYLGRLRGYSDLLGRALVGAAAGIGVADRLWAPDFRDRMAVVARRAR